MILLNFQSAAFVKITLIHRNSIKLTMNRRIRDGIYLNSADDTFYFYKRTIMALWRARILNPYQKEQITEEHEDQEVLVMPEDSGSILEDEAKMSRIYSAELPIKVTINHYEDKIHSHVCKVLKPYDMNIKSKTLFNLLRK